MSFKLENDRFFRQKKVNITSDTQFLLAKAEHLKNLSSFDLFKLFKTYQK